MLPIWLLAAMMMIYDDDDVLLDVLGTLRECYVSSLLGLTTFPPTRARVSGKRLVAKSDPNATSRQVVFR